MVVTSLALITKSEQSATATHLLHGKLVLGKIAAKGKSLSPRGRDCSEKSTMACVVRVILSSLAGSVLNPRIKQPRIKRLNAAADIEVFAVKDSFDHCLASGQYACNSIAVPTYIFCSRLRYQVNTICNGLLKNRCAVTVIANGYNAVFFCQCCCSGGLGSS